VSDKLQLDLDTSQARDSIKELLTQVKALESTFDNISAKNLISQYGGLQSTAAALKKEIEGISKIDLSSAGGVKQFKEKIAEAAANVKKLSGEMAQQGLATDRAKAATVSYRATVDGISHSFRELSYLSSDRVKTLADLEAGEKSYRKIISDASKDYRGYLRDNSVASIEERNANKARIKAFEEYEKAQAKAVETSKKAAWAAVEADRVAAASQDKTNRKQLEAIQKNLTVAQAQEDRRVHAKARAEIKTYETDEAEKQSAAKARSVRGESQAMQIASVDRASELKSARGDRSFARIAGADLADVKNLEKLVTHLRAVKGEMDSTTRNMAIEQYGKDAVIATANLKALEQQLKQVQSANDLRKQQDKTGADTVAVMRRQQAERNLSMGNAFGFARDAADQYTNLGKRIFAAKELVAQFGEAETRAFLGKNAYLVDKISDLNNYTKAVKSATAASSDAQNNASFTFAGADSKVRTVRKIQYLQSEGASLSELKDRYGSIAVGDANSGESIRALHREYERLDSTVRKASKGLKEVSNAKNEAHAAARGLAGSLGQLWTTYGSIVPLLAGAAVGGALKELVTIGAKVEDQLTLMEAVGGGAKVSMTALAAATKDSVFSFAEATSALRVLVQAGQTTQQALQVLPQILKVSAIGEIELGKAALTVASMMESFNFSIGEASRVTNSMAAAAARSPTSMGEMMEAMKQASAISSQYKVSIEETSAAFSILAKRGIEGSAAGTSFRNLVAELSAPTTKKAAEAMQQLGLSMFNKSGNLNPLVENLEQIAVVAKSMSEEDRIKWFETFTNNRSAKSLDALVMNMKDYRDAIKEVTLAQEGLGFVTETNAARMMTTQGQWKQLGTDIGVVFADVFNTLQPTLMVFINTLRDAVSSNGFKESMIKLAETLASVTKFAMENATAIGYLIATLAGRSVIMAAAGAFIYLGTAIGSLGVLGGVSSLFASFGTLLANPVVAAIAGAALGIGALVAYLNSTKSASTEAAEAVSVLTVKSEILAKSAASGRAEIEKENQSLVDNIIHMKEAARAATDLVVAKKWAALQEAKEGRERSVRETNRVEAAYVAKYGQSSSEPLSTFESAKTLGKRETERTNVQNMVQGVVDQGVNVKSAQEDYDRAVLESTYKKYLKTQEDSLSEAIKLNETRTARIDAGIRAEKIIASGTSTEALKKQVESGKKAAKTTPIEIEGFNKESIPHQKQVEKLKEGLEGTETKAPKIEEKGHKPYSGVDRTVSRTEQDYGKEIDQIYKRGMDTIAMEEKVAEARKNHDLLTEREYSDLQDKFNQDRIAAATKRYESYKAKLESLGKDVNKATAEDLKRKVDTAGEERTTAINSANLKKEEKTELYKVEVESIPKVGAKDVAKLRDENRQILEQKEREFQITQEMDPYVIASREAQIAVAERYRSKLAEIQALIEKSEGSPEKQQEYRGVKKQLEDQMGQDQGAASAQAVKQVEYNMSPFAGINAALKEINLNAKDLSGTFRTGLTGSLEIAAQGFVSLATTGKLNVRSMVADMLVYLTKLMAHKAFMMVANMAMSAMFAGSSAPAGAASGAQPVGAGPVSQTWGGAGTEAFSASSFQANGGAWSQGVQMFAKGGAFTNTVVDTPTLFKFAKGTGMMGEAGPEAIMPLTRDGSGRLGVRAQGAGGGGNSVVINQQFNVAVESKGDKDGRNQGDEIAKTLKTQMRQATMEVLLEQKRPGGVLA